MTPLFRMTVPPLLPKPKGEPGAMTAMAEGCRKAAGDLHIAMNAGDGAMASMGFNAPVVSRLKGSVAGNTGAIGSLGDDLLTFAGELEVGAEKLQDRIDKYEQRKEDHAAAIKNNRAFDLAMEAKEQQEKAAPTGQLPALSGPLFR